MNLKEFAALAVGDRIENHMSRSSGEVVTVDGTGVRVRWDCSGRHNDGILAAMGVPTWHYSVNSQAWTHWSKAEPAVGPELDAALDAFVADKPASIATE